LLPTSDEFESRWLEPQLKLKYFQLGLARDLFHFSPELKIEQKQAKILILS
jgi:hypothetical protein